MKWVNIKNIASSDVLKNYEACDYAPGSTQHSVYKPPPLIFRNNHYKPLNIYYFPVSILDTTYFIYFKIQILLSSTYSWEPWGSERLIKLPKVTQSASWDSILGLTIRATNNFFFLLLLTNFFLFSHISFSLSWSAPWCKILSSNTIEQEIVLFLGKELRYGI